MFLLLGRRIMSCSVDVSHWRVVQRRNFVNIEKLANFLELDNKQRQFLLQKPRFVLNLPLRLAKKIEKRTLDDPILKQFLPTTEETIISEGFGCDPVGDVAAKKGPKLLHKYDGRVLLVCTGACVMHCRYCFRQNFDYDVKDKLFDEELEYIRNDPSIHEVILSGGDPLSLSNETLGALLLKIGRIPHVNRIRFHSRFPVGIPERIDEGFLSILRKLSQQIWFVVHCNHPRELDTDLYEAFRRLQNERVLVLNQSVLLKGVNDEVKVLKELFESLSDHGVLPYYLHQLDRVQGIAHFEVPVEKGKALIQALTSQLPGYAVPKFVQEIPEEPSKTPII